VKLRAFVIIDLKMQPFRPGIRGQDKFLSLGGQHLVGHRDDQLSIGLSLCKTRDRLVAGYSLQDVSKPIGVSEYQLAAALPRELKGKLPTIAEIEDELSGSSD
jgi:YhcG PDDEXK nuclease domain